MKLTSILVPLDGSPLGEASITRAAELAVESGARVVLLRAAEAHLFPGDLSQAQVKVVEEAETYLAGVAARMRALGVNEVRTSVWYGPPAAAVAEAATLNHADLIVMTTHGRSGLGRLVMGSVAESVLRATTTPILLLRDRQAPVDVPAGATAATSSC